MPQPNINKMLKQVQQMQADMMKAQEQLKDEVVEASAGGGMVTVKMTGDLEVKEIGIDPAALGDDELAPRTSRCSRTWCWRPSTRRSARPQELAKRKLGGLTGGLGDRPRRSRLCRACRPARPLDMFAPPVNRLITELAKLPGIGQRTAQRLAFHILRVPRAGRARARRRRSGR